MMKKSRKRIDNPSDQHHTIIKVINALLMCYRKSQTELYYEKTLTHEFYHQLRKQKPTHSIIPEFPVKEIIKENMENERFDFFLYLGDYYSNDNLVLEFKRNEYNPKTIKKDLIKLEKISIKYQKINHRKSIRPILILFYTEPINFYRYSNLIYSAYINSPIHVLAVGPSLEINSVHQKLKRKDGSTAINIRQKCLITNYQKLVDYNMVGNESPIILHPRLNGRVRKTILYSNNEKIVLDNE